MLSCKKRRAVWFLQKYPPSVNAGAEWTAHQLNLFLLKKGWHVTVITEVFPIRLMEGVKIVLLSESQRVEKAITRASIFLSQNQFSRKAVDAAASTKLPLVLCMHGSFAKPYLEEYLPLLQKGQLRLLHNSNWIRDFYDGFHLDAMILYPPIDSSRLPETTTRRYISLINCSDAKGGHVFAKMAIALPNHDFLGVIGSYGEQILRRDIQNISYMENTPDISKFYSQIGILVMPSDYESWGRTAVEAMTMGIPVIAHPTEGLRESLGCAGLFADREKPEEWIRLIRLLLENPWFYAAKSTQGIQRAKELDTRKQLESVEEWIDNLHVKKDATETG